MQGVFDLSLGDKLGRLGKEIEASVLRCLLQKAEKPLLALEAPPNGEETPVEATRRVILSFALPLPCR